MTTRLTRAGLIAGAAAGVAAAAADSIRVEAASAGGTASPFDDGSELFGVVRSVDGRTIHLRTGQVVTVLEDAVVRRWGTDSTAESFRPGDELVMAGTQVGDTFEATAVTSAYRDVHGLVQERGNGSLRLADGTRLTIESGVTRPWRNTNLSATPVDEIAVGDVISALAASDAEGKRLVAVLVGVS
jgi:hypothetical protein